MEENKLVCSSQKHKENDAISFCYECKIYMCNKCENYHLELFQNHHQSKIDKTKNVLETFTGLCNEKNHLDELNYFCKTHKELCCAKCVTKIKGKENGQHSDCEICFIEDIEKEKKDKLNENIILLEELSLTFEKSMKELTEIIEKVDKNKESLKYNIQKIFTKIRSALNDREDKLLSEIYNKFNEIYYNEKDSTKLKNLSKMIKESLEKGKTIQNQWNDNKLNTSLNICLNIENNIRYINNINSKIQNNSSLEKVIKFYPEDNGVDKFLEQINNFGYFNIKILGKLLKEKDIDLLQNWIKSDDK